MEHALGVFRLMRNEKLELRSPVSIYRIEGAQASVLDKDVVATAQALPTKTLLCLLTWPLMREVADAIASNLVKE